MADTGTSHWFRDKEIIKTDREIIEQCLVLHDGDVGLIYEGVHTIKIPLFLISLIWIITGYRLEINTICIVVT